MSVNFDSLQIGNAFDRPTLAELWGYQGYQAISRGVVTPADSNAIILFVTKEKQETLTQYNDYIDQNLLHWEGEEKHGSDYRIINASREGSEIHLFYREIHHSPFLYFGQIKLTEHRLLTDGPSKFIFSIGNTEEHPDVLDDLETHQDEIIQLDQTERSSVSKSRIGQGIFRERVIILWGSCSVTGLSNLSLLRASHIKPWRDCTNSERLDPLNGLLLNPTLDHLFDSGLVTFDEDGNMLVSSKISLFDMELLHIDLNSKLRKMPEGMKIYMSYHRERIFIDG